MFKVTRQTLFFIVPSKLWEVVCLTQTMMSKSILVPKHNQRVKNRFSQTAYCSVYRSINKKQHFALAGFTEGHFVIPAISKCAAVGEGDVYTDY